jgi:hypothetical protein
LSALKSKLTFPTRDSATSSPSPELAAAVATPMSEALILQTPETPTKTPPPKKSRTSHLQTPPSPVNLEQLERGAEQLQLVTAALQSALTNPGVDKKGFNIESLPVHEGRIVPPSFGMEFHSVYLRLPEAVLPAADQKLTGKSNYTIASAEKSAVQIQLSNKNVFIVRTARAPWQKTSGTPNVAWAKYASMEEARLFTVDKVGGWTPAP